MRPLNADEKSSTVILYTASMLVRGDIILRDGMRVSIWPRTQGVPNFIHLFNVQIIQIAGSAPKNYARDEVFVPTPEVIGFHLAPPAHDPLDYDVNEGNRKIQPVQIMADEEPARSAGISVATPVGFLIDGLDIEGVIRLWERLR